MQKDRIGTWEVSCLAVEVMWRSQSTTVRIGKGPDFWCAFEDDEVVVIGDEPENTIKDRRCPRLLCRGAKKKSPPRR